MISFTISHHIQEKLRKLESAILAKYVFLTTLDRSTLDQMHSFAFISMIGASTRIENALLTDLEIKWIDTILTQDSIPESFSQQKAVIENKLSKDKERSIEEVAGCRQLLLEIYGNFDQYLPLRESHLRTFHSLLLSPYQGAGPYVGRYKGLTNSVIETNALTKKTKVIFKTADAGVITQCAMKDLLDWYNKEEWALPVVCEFIFRFLTIHPFQDGNGRLARALTLLLLLQSPHSQWSKVISYLAIDRQIEKNKDEYYYVLNKCSNGKYSEDPTQYKINYFLDFIIKMLFLGLEDIDYYAKKIQLQKKLSANAIQIMQCFEQNPQLRLSTMQIIEWTNIPRRTVINGLNILLKNQFIQKLGQGRSVRYQLTF